MGNVKIVVGLGNPGRTYEHTPHNAGFNVIDELAGRFKCALRRSLRMKARIGRVLLSDCEVWLVKPATYVNRSGQAVAAVLRKLNAAPDDLLLVLDDADLEAGQIRIRKSGGDGGHNGLKSIIEYLGTNNFTRVRLGIGRDEHDEDLAKHVLKRLDADSRREMKAAALIAADAVYAIIEQGAEAAMNSFNKRNKN